MKKSNVRREKFKGLEGNKFLASIYCLELEQNSI
jgi:hypothetical protein